MLLSYLAIAILLLGLNAFFVLAEFAFVKLRPSRVEELIDRGHALSPLLKHIQDHIDSYLSVCQLGITLASIGLGFVGEPAFAQMLQPFLERFGSAQVAVSHAVGVGMAYIMISLLHIFFGEIVPKSIAIRIPEKSAVLTAPLLRIFHIIFHWPLVVINSSANVILRAMGLPISARDTSHSEKEVRIILEDSQQKGLVSFRRLLLMENILDLGALRVRNIMRTKDVVRTLRTDQPWTENQRVIRDSRFSRYPLVDRTSKKPYGIIHAKDLVFTAAENLEGEQLKSIMRRYVETTETTRLEELLAQMQHYRAHVAIVLGRSGLWTGFLTLEDITEQIVGAVEDEFQRDIPSFLADAINPARVILNIKGDNLQEAIGQIVQNVPATEWPVSPALVRRALLERERNATTYIGQSMAVPHARLNDINRPVLAFARSPEGIAIPNSDDKVHLIFVLLTPVDQPQLQLRLISRLIRLMGSEFVEGRLYESENPLAVIEAIQAGETATLT